MLGFPQKKNQVKLSDRKSFTRISHVNELVIGAECKLATFFAGTLRQTLLAKYRYMTLPPISGVWNKLSF